MRIIRRPFSGWGMHNHRTIGMIPGAPDRPVNAYSAGMRLTVANMSGPMFRGMDPSDPTTFTRPWNPAPGMIEFLNFDGASMQAHTPTQVQRGPQSRPRKLRVGF
jgi:hypothetical protein